jgi:hypothetical protein
VTSDGRGKHLRRSVHKEVGSGKKVYHAIKDKNATVLIFQTNSGLRRDKIV